MLICAVLIGVAAASRMAAGDYDARRDALLEDVQYSELVGGSGAVSGEHRFGLPTFDPGHVHVSNLDALRGLTPFAKTIVLLRHLAKTGDKRIEQHMFSGWFKGSKSLREVYSGYTLPRSIVTGCPNKYYPLLVLLIRAVREIHMSDIPFEVFYMGSGDLSADKVRKLRSLDNVYCTDLSEVIDQNVQNIRSWTIKPFAMLLSRGIETLYVDADAVLMQPPETFFNYAPYQTSGALYFKDRYIFPRDGFNDWLTGVMAGVPHDLIDANDMANGTTGYLQESGVVLIDKRRHFWVLVLAAVFNDVHHRSELYSRTWGDKESYWMASMALNKPYSWGPMPAGHAGVAISGGGGEAFNGRLCDVLAHYDASGKLWWMNDGLLSNKQNVFSPLRQFAHYAVSTEGKWAGICLDGVIHKIGSKETSILERLRAMYIPNPTSA